MRRVTLLLSGVPQYVTLRDLSYNLDRLFNTDEIETFKVRDLPNHPQTNKRQIALDFRSSYDAMAAQEKLEGYTYELDNGREYTLHAKINKSEEYMCSESPEYGGSRWYGGDWMSLAMIPNVSDSEIYRAHARLDAQLELLNKQKLVLEKEKELLNERQKLKQKYGSMVSSLYEASSMPQYNQYAEHTYDTEAEVSPPKRSRSTSQHRSSSSKHPRSRSREIRPRGSRRSRSKDSGYVLPQIEWYEERTKRRELRSHSGERSRSRAYSRDWRSNSRERRDHRYPVSRHREPRSRSNEIPGISEVFSRSPSKERVIRARSRSQNRMVHSRPRSRERKSHSRERKYSRWSRPLDRIPDQRSRSRDRAYLNDDRVSRSGCDHRGRRLRSPDIRTDQLAIMPRSSRESPSEWSVDSLEAGTPTDTKRKTYDKNKEVRIKVEKDAKNTIKQADTKENKKDNTKNIKDKERKKVDKYNSKLRKAETASRVQALSKDVMVLVAIVVDEVIDRDRIRISAANKVTLIKILEALIQKRLEPIARVKNNDDSEVLKKYKMQYPMNDDLKMIEQMLDKIPKLEMREPEATITVSPEIDKTAKDNVVGIEVLDEDSKPVEQQCTTNNISVDLTQVESTDNALKIKTEPKDEPILIIDIDSAEKPVPRYPQFVVVIKNLVKNMNKVIRTNKLGGEIKFAELKHVLRHILRNMLKGQGYIPREEIIRKFREIYPKENDEHFVRNTIKDIREGKYPGLASQVVDAPENDCPDDVVIIEKKYDVVTLTDSDVDDVNVIDDDVKKPNMEVISLDSDPIHDCHDSGQADPSQAIPAPINDHFKLGAVNPGQEGSSNSGQDQLRSTNTDQANKDLVKPDQAKTASDNRGQTNMNTDNVNEVNIDRTETDPIIESANSGQANSCNLRVAPRRGRDMPEVGSPGQVKTLANPIQVQTSLVSPGHTNTDPAKPSLCCTANLSQDMSGPANSSQIKTGLGNPDQDKTGVPNSNQAKTSPANHSQVVPGHEVACPNNPGQAKTCPSTNKGPNNPGHSNTDALLNAHQTKNSPTNAGQAKKGPANSGQAQISPDNPGQAKTWPLNTSQATKGPNDPGRAKKDSVNISRAMSDPSKPSQAETCPISREAKVPPSNTMSIEEKEKKASLDSTIQNLESNDGCNIVVISPPSFKIAHRERKKKRRERKHAGKGIRQTPESNKINLSNEDSGKHSRTNNEENDNNLKVTAITIFTSLNDLIAKTTANESETISTNEIKEEIEIKEEAELDESSLNLDNAPRVTSITIMTSDAELLSLGNEKRKEVNEIKNETDVYYDAEDNLVKDIERAFDDVNFGNIPSESTVHNSVDSDQFLIVNNTGQLSSVNNSGQFDKTECLPQDRRTVPDDEETIESIVKYVASMY